MPRLKCSFGEFVRIIEAHGFRLHRHAAGSHAIYRKEEAGRVWLVTVAAHAAGDDVPIGTLQSMIRQSGLAKRLFRKWAIDGARENLLCPQFPDFLGVRHRLACSAAADQRRTPPNG